MLKGTTRIELTDVNTGEVETYQNSNMVTNALRDVLKPLGLSKRPNRFLNEFVPYYEHLLGGILCFDTEIPEDADNYYPPAKANLTGCAVYGEQNNTKNTVRGGFNQTESEVNLKDRYVKYVYDFATSQANGTIASVCLTHKNGGKYSYADAVDCRRYTAVCLSKQYRCRNKQPLFRSYDWKDGNDLCYRSCEGLCVLFQSRR